MVRYPLPHHVVVVNSTAQREEKTGWTNRLKLLLDLGIQSAALDGNDLGRGVRVVGNGRAALAAEDAVHGLARGALAGPRLGRAVDGELVLGDDDHEGWIGLV